MEKKIRGLVISAGGSKGSYAGGIVEYYKENGIEYDVMVGSSTGAIMLPLIVSNSIEVLKSGYTSITDEDIFTRNPFKIIKGKNGVFKYGLDFWNIFKNLFIYKKPTIGDNSKFRYETLPRFLTEDVYDKMVNICDIKNKEVAVCVTNFTLNKKEFKDIHKCSYNDMLDWLWASISAPPFMSIVEKNNYEYIDGGVMTMVAIKESILRGSDIIDVIVLREENPTVVIEKTRNLLHFIINLLYKQMDNKMSSDIDLLNLLRYIPNDKEIIINMHYTTHKLTNNALMFDKEVMCKWWDEGYEYAKNEKCKSYLVSKKGFELLD